MFRSYSATIVADCDFELSLIFGKRNLDRTVFRSKPQRVVEQICQSALEKVGVRVNFPVADTADRNMTVIRECLIKRRNFLDGRTRIKSLALDRFPRRVHTGDK